MKYPNKLPGQQNAAPKGGGKEDALGDKRKNVEAIQIGTMFRMKGNTHVMAVKPEEWKELRLTVDSGAAESVTPPDEADNVTIVDGERKGAPLDVANAAIVRNQGQWKCKVVTGE